MNRIIVPKRKYQVHVRQLKFAGILLTLAGVSAGWIADVLMEQSSSSQEKAEVDWEDYWSNKRDQRRAELQREPRHPQCAVSLDGGDRRIDITNKVCDALRDADVSKSEIREFSRLSAQARSFRDLHQLVLEWVEVV